MKETYFLYDNIEKVTHEIFKYISQYAKIRNVIIDRKSTALLVLDMQNYFLNEKSHAFVPSSKAIIPGIKKLINFFDINNLPVIFTRHVNTNNNAGMMALWWKELITVDNEYFNIYDDLNYSGAEIIDKSQYDAFYNTELEDYLTKLDIHQLIVTGLMTHLCCETTIRSAFVRGFEVFFPIDGTATYNLEFHKSSFLNLAHGLATPVLINDLLNQI